LTDGSLLKVPTVQSNVFRSSANREVFGPFDLACLHGDPPGLVRSE